MQPAAIITDIEGTTTPIDFVHKTLFPYARARMASYLAAHAQDAAVREALGEIERLAPGADPLATLLGWMDADAKITPLKTLQGLIWHEGYEAGELTGELYPDAAPALKAWAASGLRLYVYSSGSEAAQKLLFGHTESGDLTRLFRGFFDTRIGAKREAASYARIATGIGLPAAECLFLSDIGAELEAAQQAGMQTCQLVRPGTASHRGFTQAADFTEVAAKFRLPGRA